MQQLFVVIVIFYISLPTWRNINPLCSLVDGERFYVFRVDYWV